MWPKSDTFQAYFEKFSTTTVIRVFNFIRTAPSLIERLFWLAILLCCATLTVWDVTNTVEKFLAELTASIVSFPVAAKGINFSNATWCLSINRESLLARFGNETLVDRVVKTFASKPSILEYFEKKLEQVEAEEDQLAQNYSLSGVNSSLTEASLTAYYAKNRQRFSDHEIALVGLTSVMLAVLVDAETPKMMETEEIDLSSSLRKIYTLYASQDTNFIDLIRVIAELNCMMQEVKLFFSHTDISRELISLFIVNICKRSTVVLKWFGAKYGPHAVKQNRICYRFVEAASAFVFRSPYDYVQLTAQVETFYADASVPDYLPIDPVGLLNTERQIPLIPEFGKRQLLVFTLDTWSSAANLRQRRCLAKEDGRGNTADCTTKCREELVKKACKCAPLISAFLSGTPSVLESCVGGELDKRVYIRDPRCRTALAFSAQETNMSCSSPCYPNCDTVLFSSSISADDSYRAITNASTLVRLRSQKFVYQSVVEFKTMDEKQLITSLGGNLSLYLGASFLALIHILVFCVKLPFEIIAGQRQTAPSAEASGGAELATTVRPRGRARNLDEILDVMFDEFANLRRQQRRTDRRLDNLISGLAREGQPGGLSLLKSDFHGPQTSF